MIIVTGGAGFIGSNLVKGLNDMGRRDILVVDDLKDGTKFRNIADCDIADYMDKDDFLAQLESGAGVSLIAHYELPVDNHMQYTCRVLVRVVIGCRIRNSGRIENHQVGGPARLD